MKLGEFVSALGHAMPSDYECKKCRLNFTVGWFHYHDFSSGYGAETMLVCNDCGTVHRVEHPITDAMPEMLSVQAGPLVAPQKVFANRLPHYRNWRGRVPTKGLETHELSCLHCKAANSLRHDWPELGAPCPACGEVIENSGGFWIT